VQFSVDNPELNKKEGDSLIAEIKGKISSTGSNLSDQLEDKLTGDFFGTLRYIPYDLAIKKILEQRKIAFGKKEDISLSTDNGSYSSHIKFWPYHKDGELDLIIETDSTLIGVEVKYKSGLSSKDKIKGKSIKDSKNQLMRELKIIKGQARIKEKSEILLLIAPSKSCRHIIEDLERRFSKEIDIEISYLTWESILECLSQLKLDDEFYSLIVTDLIELLSRKGFEKFTNFNLPGDIVINKFHFEYLYSIPKRLKYNFDNNCKINEGGYYEYK